MNQITTNISDGSTKKQRTGLCCVTCTGSRPAHVSQWTGTAAAPDCTELRDGEQILQRWLDDDAIKHTARHVDVVAGQLDAIRHQRVHVRRLYLRDDVSAKAVLASSAHLGERHGAVKSW